MLAVRSEHPAAAPCWLLAATCTKNTQDCGRGEIVGGRQSEDKERIKEEDGCHLN